MSLSFSKLTDLLREKKVKVSELQAPAKNLLNLGALRDYMSLPGMNALSLLLHFCALLRVVSTSPLVIYSIFTD